MNLKTRQLSSIALRITSAALMLAATLGFSCTGETDPTLRPLGVALTVDPVPVTPQGGTATLHVHIARQKGFTSAFSLKIGIGVNFTAQPVLVPDNATDADVIVNVEKFASVGQTAIGLYASAVGYNDVDVSVPIIVTAPGSFVLTVDDSKIPTLYPGHSVVVTANFLRNAFTGPITFDITPIAGTDITLSYSHTVTGNSNDITVTAAPNAATNVSVPLTIEAHGNGTPYQNTTVYVSVKASIFTLTSTSLLDVFQGSTTPASITIARDPFNTAPITITGTAATTNGITATPVTISGSATQAQMQVTVLPNVAPGIYPLTLRATQPGLSPDITTVTLVKVSAVSFGLQVETAPLNIIAGGPSLTDIVKFNRVNFTNAITVTGASDPGISIAANPSPTTADQTTLTIGALASVSAGTHIVTLTATAPGLANVTTTFAVVVGAPLTNTSFTFCGATGTPGFVAVQDGSTGAWTTVTSSNSTYAFNIANTRGAIAYVVPNGNGGYSQRVYYGSQGEIASQGTALCAGGTGSPRVLSGTAVNIGTAAQVNLGAGGASTLFSPPTSSFFLSNVQSNPVDLVASTSTGATPPTALKMLIRRGVTGSALGALDFTGTESFVPVRATATLANALGAPSYTLGFQVHTNNNAQTFYYFGTTTSPGFEIFGVPAAQRQVGDIHFLDVQANDDATSTRSVGVMLANVANQGLTFGPALSTPVVTTLVTTPVARLRTVLAVQANYNKLFQVQYAQNGNSALVQMTAAYANGASTVTLDMPDLSALTGWSNTFGLVAGSSTQATAKAFGWTGADVGVFPSFVDGVLVFTASKRVSTTP